MIMHDVTKMPIIGKVTTKPLTYNVTFGDKTQAYEMPAETYSVVHIFEDDGQKTYVTNVWHKEYKRVPLLIIEKLVDNYQPILEEGGYLHGSSHEFCDTGFKLDTEKEGQGESLFGRGLYFTKDQKLAEYYAKFVKPEGVNDAIRQKVADKLGFKTYDEIPYDFENKKIKTKYGEHLKFDLFHQYLKQYVDKSKEKGNIYKVTLFPGKDNSEYRILDFSGENHQLQENIERDKKDLKNIIDTLVKNKRKYSTWIKSYFDDKGLEFDPEKYNSDFKSTLRDMKDYYDNFYTYSTSTPLLKNLAYDLKKIFKPEFFRFTKNPLELTNDPNHYMSLQENRVKFNEDAKIYQGKRLTDFFQEAGYNAITYSFSPSIIPLEDNGEYDANAIVIFNDKDVKIDECEKAEDGKNIYSKPKLIKKSILNDFQSGSSLDFYDNKIFVVGDDTKDLLIINSDFQELNRVRLFESKDRRIAKDLKADLETSTIINHNDAPSILMLGSGARDNKSFGYIIPFNTLKVTEPFKYDVFINRLKNEHGIEKVNIEGSASLEDYFILSNRGNKNNPDNFLIVTGNNFWENQSTVKISISRLLLPNKDAGVSEIYYETDSDTLLFTASVEQTTNNYDDGEIGDSFIGYISSFSNKLNENTVTPDLFLNLTEIDSSFDKHKIEGICIENKSDEYYTINLVSDNDNDESTIFKIELKKQNIIAADGKKINTVLYHGSNKKFKEFNDNEKGSSMGKTPSNMLGFYFTDNKQVASSFGDFVYTCRISLRKPFIVDAKGKDYSQFKYKLNDISDSIDKKKYDGIIIKNYKDSFEDEPTTSNQYVVFDKSNIEIIDIAADGKKIGGIPERYRDMGFTKVGQKKTSTIPTKKWMVLARKGDKYKVVHGGYKGMEDYSQHHDDVRRKRFWNRMGGFDSEKANDPFSPLYWHKKFGTWEDGGPIYDNGGLIAPNGKKSNLTPEQYKLVRTNEFKAWFGDWENYPEKASKVIDKNGEPLVVYHGTNSRFNIFKENFPNDKSVRVGHWFTNNKELATNYGKSKQYFIKANKITTKTRDDYDDLGYDAYMYKYNVFNEDLDKLIPYFNINVYESNQIKIADGSNTTFDSSNPDIRYDNGGLVTPNGENSNLTPELYKIVRTPEFKAWFGDWEKEPNKSSKALDRNGEPAIYYHGSSDKNITIFDRRKSKSRENTIGQFIYFSKEKEYSSQERFIGENGTIYEVFLNARNPLNIFDEVSATDVSRFFRFTGSENKPESFNLKWRGDWSSAFEEILSENEEPDLATAVTKFGYDSVYYHNSAGDEMLAIINSNQIKLIENTTFDRENPDIRAENGIVMRELTS